MSDQSCQQTSPNMYGVPGLEKFIDRLQPGMELEGRIVEAVGDHTFILRIWGNNILTESHYPFKKFDEVILLVRSIKPKLIFSLRPNTPSDPEGPLYA